MTLPPPPAASGSLREPLLSIRDLTVAFPDARFKTGRALAVQHVSLDVFPGEWVSVVGESGCGKSLTLLSILNLVPEPGEIACGTITFEGQNLLKLKGEAIRKIRGAKIALIPQDPLSALNPVYTVGEQVMEVLQLHRGLSRKLARKWTQELFDQVRIPNAAARLDAYPHELSGGMRQRVMIAMALSCQPKLLLADEPTTALDVTVQAQILQLLDEIRRETSTAVLMITHDLGVVAQTADRVAVMYAGEIVEQGTRHEVLTVPSHPYTQALLASIPDQATPGQRLHAISGQPPGLRDPLGFGCAFTPRCPKAQPTCRDNYPPLVTLPGQHTALCWLAPQPTR